VHEVAEQLEHIQSSKLIERLDDFLGYPEFDPHGDPIPNSKGELPHTSTLALIDAEPGKGCKLVAVRDTSSAFLQQLEKLQLQIGTVLTLKEVMSYDNSVMVSREKGDPFLLSEKIARNILVAQ
jgi:DtxR family Mn-dependent transcriptional regulator